MLLVAVAESGFKWARRYTGHKRGRTIKSRWTLNSSHPNQSIAQPQPLMPPQKAALAKGAGKGGVAGKKKKKGEAAAPPPPPEDPAAAAHRRALIERAVALLQEVDREMQAAIELRNAVVGLFWWPWH